MTGAVDKQSLAGFELRDLFSEKHSLKDFDSYYKELTLSEISDFIGKLPKG